jgi:hypothetical protein
MPGWNPRRRLVVIHGLPYFCAKLLKVLEDENWDVRFQAQYSMWGLLKLVVDLARCDLAFTWGGRISMGMFLWAARCLRKRHVVILWCGSDVLYAKEDLKAGRTSRWLAQKHHWAVSPVLTEEVRALGLDCEYVQTSFVDPIKDIVPLPEKFSVLTFVPGLQKGSLYGLDQIQAVAAALPEVEFKIVGWLEGKHPNGLSNLKVLGRSEDLTPFYQQATVLWRPVLHDAGVSFMVLEALAQGRHVIYSYSFPACVKATSIGEAQWELEKLRSLHLSGKLGLNETGANVVREVFSPKKVRSTLFRKWGEILRPSATNSAGLPEEHELRSSSPAHR